MADSMVDPALHEPGTDDTAARGARDESAPTTTTSADESPGFLRRHGRTVRIALATVVVMALLAVSVLLFLQTRTLRAERAAAADRAHAEQLATDYAVNAATMDYRDLTPWLNAMKTGVTEDLSKKFDSIGDTMREILTPLRMTSSGKALFAHTTSEVNGIYQVKVAVDVNSENVQAPQGLTSTTAYSVTLDRNQGWTITEVGDPANPSLPFTAPGAAPASAPTGAPR